MKLSSYHILLLSFFCILSACTTPPPAQLAKKNLSFGNLSGIKFIEVRRAFDTGLAFNEQGFQQEPNWTLYFLAHDSVKIYSPGEQRYIHYPIYFDHDSVVNFAREWLRIKKITRDSLVFQLLQVDNKVISRERSNVYMTFYAENYMKNRLNINPDRIKQLDRRDTLFIRKKVERANHNPDLIDSVFSARNPVVLKSKSNIIEVMKVNSPEDIIDQRKADEYLYPEYNIAINKAYKDFNYSFSVLVDDKGIMRFGKPKFLIMPEFEASTLRVMKGIMEIYLQNLLEITPGNTLGMPHTSLIMLNVKGKKE